MDTKYIKDILTEDIRSLGFDIWGIEFFGKHKNQTLRIYIDNKEGITLFENILPEPIDPRIDAARTLDQGISAGWIPNSPGVQVDTWRQLTDIAEKVQIFEHLL